MIPRAFRSSGTMDPNIIANLNNAHSAGFKYVDVYLFPCPTCSASAATQVDTFKKGMSGVKALYGTVWVDIEASSLWTGSLTKNIAFAEALVKALKDAGFVVGLYANRTQWTEIFGSGYTGLGGFPTWVAKYDSSPSCGNLPAFGPYKTSDFNLKQYQGMFCFFFGRTRQIERRTEPN